MFANNRAVPLVLAVFGVGLLAVCASLFATGQSIWLDETTQLSGLTLDFEEQLRWLTGRSNVVLGVPPDRMPPLSYWLGGLWAQAFGLSEMSIRSLGILAICASAPALYLTGRRVAGNVGGVFLVWLLLPTPVTMVLAGEIRAYPLFLAFSIWAVWAFARLAFPDENSRQWRDFSLLILFSLLMGFTHYFGVVAAGCLFAGLFVQRIAARAPVVPVVAAGVVVVVLLGGLWPFIAAAIDVSGTRVENSVPPQFTLILLGLGRLSLRLVMHQVLLVSLPVLWLFLVCLAVLGLGAIMALSSSWKDPGRGGFAVVVVPALALVALGVLKPLVTGFSMVSPLYSIWLMPVAGLGLCLAFQNRQAHGPVRRIATGAAAIGIVASNLLGLATILGQGGLYSHGPGEWIANRISEPSEALVIHDGRDLWGHIYFPLFYLTGGQTEQWRREEDGTMSRITATGIEPVLDPDALLTGFSQILEIRTLTVGSRGLADIASGAKTCAETIDQTLQVDNKAEVFCASVSAAVVEKRLN